MNEKRRFSVLVMAALLSVSLIAGCRSAKDNDISDNNIPIDNNRAEDINSMDLNEVDRLPEGMKEDPLNKTLEEMRDFRRKHYSEKDGSLIGASKNDDNLPGQTKKRPHFSYDELYEVVSVIQDYVENVAKIPRRGYGYDTDQCIDPRMNAIYDDEDKGVATGYENENIFVAEYETEKDGVYSYLVLVRDSEGGSWKIIHDGLSYKEK